MNLTHKWNISYQSVCRIAQYKDNILIGTGTGFKLGDYLITNNHVYFPKDCDYIVVTFVDRSSSKIEDTQKFSNSQWSSMLLEGSPENQWDYAILDLSNTSFVTRPGLLIAPKEENIQIGKNIYFLGYPLMQENLTIHSGFISSQYTKYGVDYIQLDGSVNSGNSGGPLIDFDRDMVVGIITRKNTGLTQNFYDLKRDLNFNIKDLEKASIGGSVRIGGIDPVHAIKIIQSQIELLSKEVERSSNVGIGYAFSLREVSNFFQ